MLKELGEIMRSPGFIERAEKYGKNYIEVPYSFPSPVALDFSIVQIDYGKMGDDVKIQPVEDAGNKTKWYNIFYVSRGGKLPKNMNGVDSIKWLQDSKIITLAW